jgi:flavin reductase (DIM6/NTAB) family NADH-FMN oxidoreductase RutF
MGAPLMENKIKTMAPENMQDNVFKLIGSDWMLITAGDLKAFNMMTASWGGCGVLWNKNICWCVIRPQRYTLTFMEKSGYFTLSFFEEKYRKELEYCGSHSGKDVDKIKKTGLTPATTNFGNIYFNEARLVVECKKIYFQDINPKNFIDASIEQNYPAKDYHRMYIGEIVSCFKKE